MEPYEPFSETVREDPYPYYAALRDEAPVYWAEGAQAWCVSRYDDVQFVLRNPELFSSDAMRTMLMGARPGVNPLEDPEVMARALALTQALAFPLEELIGWAPTALRGSAAAYRDAEHRQPRLHATTHRDVGAARARIRPRVRERNAACRGDRPGGGARHAAAGARDLRDPRRGAGAARRFQAMVGPDHRGHDGLDTHGGPAHQRLRRGHEGARGVHSRRRRRSGPSNPATI